MKSQNLKQLIIELLEKKPELKDDDQKLIANVWWCEIGKDKSLSAVEFLKKMTNGELTQSETIRRNRQLLQEQFTELQGEKYLERQKYGASIHDAKDLYNN